MHLRVDCIIYTREPLSLSLCQWDEWYIIVSHVLRDYVIQGEELIVAQIMFQFLFKNKIRIYLSI